MKSIVRKNLFINLFLCFKNVFTYITPHLYTYQTNIGAKIVGNLNINLTILIMYCTRRVKPVLFYIIFTFFCRICHKTKDFKDVIAFVVKLQSVNVYISRVRWQVPAKAGLSAIQSPSILTYCTQNLYNTVIWKKKIFFVLSMNVQN